VHPEEGQLPLDFYALGRGLAYSATLVLIGTCVYAALIPRWRAPTDDDRSLAARALAGIWRIAAVATGVLVVAHLIRAYGQVRSFLDPLEPFTWEAARPVLFQTTWGRSWLVQLLVACVAVPVALLAGRRPPAGLALLTTVALGVAATSPLTGHAAANPWGRPLGVGLHAVHLIGGGLWLGTLFSMVVAGLGSTSRVGATDHAAVARMVRAFSPVALTGAAMAVGAGSLMAYAYIGDLSSLFGTTYGRTLLVKIGLLALTMMLGAWNWRRVTPRLGTVDGTRVLTRSATLELLIGLLLVATTAVLVALPAPQV
jgi:putative copper export protein